MNYQETIEYLYAQLPVYHRIGKAAYKGNLNNSIALDQYFGHPHKKFRTVHIAGTNGKGSVSHMIASVLQEAGYKTGLYTSPHLLDYRERIKINGSMIPEEEVVLFVEKNKDILHMVGASFFEMSVAMAFDYFARAGVDVAVIEVGLGGRLDSTNIISPVLSVITNIGHDHMDLLGDSLEKIAGEKAGIIKKNVPSVVGEKNNITRNVFIEISAQTGSELFFAEDLFECWLEEMDMNSGDRKYYLIQSDRAEKLWGESPLGGNYQSKNISVVACATTVLRRHFEITPENFVNGIKNIVLNTGLKGRWQILGNSPLIICDTGHNREGLEFVMEQVKSISKRKLHIIIGFVNDKDLSGVLHLFPGDALYYFTKASVPRALDERILEEVAGKYGLMGESFENVELALLSARKNATTEDMIFIGGSTFIVADLLRIF
jgi:dihydrofolate synthase/folylpolyglutamate synthase